jgi:hypothetical protein
MVGLLMHRREETAMSEDHDEDYGPPLTWDELPDGLSDEELDERLAALSEQVAVADKGVEAAFKHRDEMVRDAEIAATRKIGEAGRNAVQRYIEFGGACVELKERTKKKKGQNWMNVTKERFPNVSHRTINYCQQFWEWRELLRRKNVLSVPVGRGVCNAAEKEAKEEKKKESGGGKIRTGSNSEAHAKKQKALQEKKQAEAYDNAVLLYSKMMEPETRERFVAEITPKPEPDPKERTQEDVYDDAQKCLEEMDAEMRDRFVAEIVEEVVPGLHQGIEQRDADLIATSVFDTLKGDLVKAEVQRVIHRLQSLVNRHDWHEGEPPPRIETTGTGAPLN